MEQLKSRKNDLCFAILLTAVLAVTVAGAIAGYRDLVRGQVAQEMAKKQAAQIARSEAGK